MMMSANMSLLSRELVRQPVNHFIGGTVWDWIDQSLYNYGQDGTRYLAYGGDFEDHPNDGQFVMNGIVFGDRIPKPQYSALVETAVGLPLRRKTASTPDIPDSHSR